VWIDEYLTAGEYYDDEIKEAMLLSDVMVQIVTENYFSAGSYTMNRELPMAKEMGLKVISVVCCDNDENILLYLKQYADYICYIKDPISIILTMEKIHTEINQAQFPETFLQLVKRIDTWYLTPRDMFELASGYLHLLNSDKACLIPPQMDDETAKRYALAATIANIDGAKALLKEFERGTCLEKTVSDIFSMG